MEISTLIALYVFYSILVFSLSILEKLKYYGELSLYELLSSISCSFIPVLNLMYLIVIWEVYVECLLKDVIVFRSKGGIK